MRSNNLLLKKQRRRKYSAINETKGKQSAKSVDTCSDRSVDNEEYQSRKKQRLCGFVEDKLEEHLVCFTDSKSLSVKNGSRCAWCEEKAHSICNAPWHNFPKAKEVRKKEKRRERKKWQFARSIKGLQRDFK